LDLDDAQIMLTNAKAQSVQARYDLAIARARLARALGQD
jgi:outer membrane protein TolC